MSKRIVITGLGVLASNGKGRQAYWQAIRDGQVGYKPVTLFDTAEFQTKQAGELSDFDAAEYLGKKGLRNLDRSTRLLVCAGRMAVEESGFIVTEENTDLVGVSTGTTLGSIKSISDFDEVTLREGPRYTNPAHFPNTVINSPSSQVSIWQNIKGFNTTISTGFIASIDAIQYAYDFLDWDRARIVYAGGVEEMCLQTFFGFYALKYISGSKEGTSFINCPFDKRRNGITFGEGACLMSMEDAGHARDRGAKILGEIVSFGYYFDPFRINKCRPSGMGFKNAMEEALNNAGMSPGDIDYICANANSAVAEDKIEAKVIHEVFGKYARTVPVSSVKSMIGECYSVSGAMAVAAALGALNEGFIPPNVNYKEPDPECNLNIIDQPGVKADLKNILITNFGPGSGYYCMVLRKFQ